MARQKVFRPAASLLQNERTLGRRPKTKTEEFDTLLRGQPLILGDLHPLVTFAHSDIHDSKDLAKNTS